MKSEDHHLAAGVPAAGVYAKHSNKSEFLRNSNVYSSLPNNATLVNSFGPLESLSKKTRNASKTEACGYWTSSKRKRHKSSHDKLISENEINHKRSVNEHCFGLSKNLSTESVRNSCEFFDDELDDSDAKNDKVPGTPKHFRSFNKQSDQGNSDGNKTNTYLLNLTQSEYEQNEANNILRELDDILDVQLDNTISSDNEMETKVENYLLDLDNYLEELDDNSSLTNYANDHSPNVKSLSKIRQVHAQCVANSSIDDGFQRGNALRKTISCSLEQKHSDTSQRIPRCNSAAWGLNITATTDQCNTRSSSISNSSENNITLSSTQECSDTISMSNMSTRNESNLTDELHQTPSSGEFRRCFSERHFSTQHNTLGNANNMLTQDDIFHNLFLNLQSGSSSALENRPRQFGRRVEGRPSSGNANCPVTITQDQRPMSAPATSITYTSEDSSIRSSRNDSPVSVDTSSDSCSTVASANINIDTNLVSRENTSSRHSSIDSETTQPNIEKGFNNEWPHSYSRTLALIFCTLGLFNMCRFAVLTIQYGGNFLLQFLLLSILFGIPFFWLQMCLGAKIKCGPVSMWKISPICKGVGIALILVQCFIAIYSTAAVGWLLVYLRDSFPSSSQTSRYRWQDPTFSEYSTNTSSNLTESVAYYFNFYVLQRMQYAKRPDGTEVHFRPVDRLAFNLAILWMAVFIILCKGLKSFGKIVFGLLIVPFIALIALICKLLYVIEPSRLQNFFSATDFDDFLINSRTWTAAAQETFLTWGLLGASVIAICSRVYANDKNKSVLHRDAILVVLTTLLGLSAAALMGILCAEILNHNNYVYVPGSYEHPDSYIAVYSLKTLPVNTKILSYPSKWVPHYSSFIGETYRRATSTHRESGYQALRFISELFPAAIALSRDSLSWVWTAIAFLMFILFGLGQLCVMWKPISSLLGINSTSSVLLTCVTGLLLGIPFATEMGISILHYMDLILGGSWFIPILWTAQIFGIFLIRGRPYNGDDLVNDLKMSGSMSAFLALSWNVLLPIGLITLAVIDYKVSLSNQFYYWRGKSYFSYWVRKVAGLTQIGFLLMIPVTAIIQIYRYLTKGPPDILDRIQLLYRPSENPAENIRNRGRNREDHNRRPDGNNTDININLNSDNLNEDSPPKYTPPPSYTTATGARLAKMLRQSIRRSVRRILGEPGRRTRPNILVENEVAQQTMAPECSNSLEIQEINETIEINQRPSSNACNRHTLSLGRKILFQKQNQQHLYTAEDVTNVLRPSTSFRSQERRELAGNTPVDSSFRSIENLIINAEPVGHSPAIGVSINEDPIMQ